MEIIKLTRAEFDALPTLNVTNAIRQQPGATWKWFDGKWVMGKLMLQGKTGIRWYEIIIDEKKYG